MRACLLASVTCAREGTPVCECSNPDFRGLVLNLVQPRPAFGLGEVTDLAWLRGSTNHHGCRGTQLPSDSHLTGAVEQGRRHRVSVVGRACECAAVAGPSGDVHRGQPAPPGQLPLLPWQSAVG
eukprot:1703632-Pyramimonas_sp.AAC.1